MVKKIVNLNLILGLVIVLIFMIFSFMGLPILEKMERYVYDVEMRLSKAEERDIGSVVIIDIDDKSLSRLGAWPWPRHLLTEMINILKSSEAKLIGLNIPFFEEEINQGLTELKAFREKFGVYPFGKRNATMAAWIRKNLKQMEENLQNDKKLVESSRHSGNVILPVFAQFDSFQNIVDRKEDSFLFNNFLTSYKVSDSLKKRLFADRLAFPFPEFRQAVFGLGRGNLTIEQNMAGRSHQMFINYKGFLMPSFPLRLAIAYLNQQPKEVLVEDNQIRLKDHIIPTINGEMLINFQNGQGAFPRYSFVDVLQGKRIPTVMKGRIIVIGLSSKESRRLMTPVSPHMSESELIAHILDNIINNRFIKRPPLMARIEFLFLFLLGGMASYIFPRMGQLRRMAWAFGLVVLTLAAGMILFFEMGIWFKTVNIAGCLGAIFLMVSARQLLLIEVIPSDSIDTNQFVGLGPQSQGLLDLAFDKFLKLPLDSETKNFVYDLGVHYEQKGLTKKALSAFEYVNKGGEGYADLEERLPRLKEFVKSSTIGSHEEMKAASIQASSSTEPLSKIGRYEILEEIGRGTMGLVYKALDPKINRFLAIKTIRFSNEFDDEVAQEIKTRFFHEAEIAGKLSHPSIVTIFDMGDDGDLTYMAMELLEGADLDKFVVKENLLPFRNVLDLVSKVADALHFAHEAGVIHRDIKPANIMLLKGDAVKVTDFGIAKAISSSRTKTGVVLGTPNYMSPEQIMGQKIDPRSDIFSLGVLYFQMLTGELPFRGNNLSGLLYEITQVEHPSVRSYNEKIPKVCERIINKALAKSSKDRFGSAGEMARVIRVLGSKIDQLREKRSIKKTTDIQGMI